MTYIISEVHTVRCDECEIEEEITVNPEFENTLDAEHYFVKRLKDDGWVYNKEEDNHYCPECAKLLESEK